MRDDETLKRDDDGDDKKDDMNHNVSSLSTVFQTTGQLSPTPQHMYVI